MNFTDLRAEPLWFEKEKINVNGETMIGLKSSDIGNKKRTEKQRQEMEKREVAFKNKIEEFIHIAKQKSH